MNNTAMYFYFTKNGFTVFLNADKQKTSTTFTLSTDREFCANELKLIEIDSPLNNLCIRRSNNE